MSAALTVERVTYECRPYTEGRRGVLCGSCRDPMTAAPGSVQEVRRPYSVADGGEWRPETDTEYRAAMAADVGICEGCGKNPADFAVFTNTARAIVEHTACRIF